jgi:hypothetical protein
MYLIRIMTARLHLKISLWLAPKIGKLLKLDQDRE